MKIKTNDLIEIIDDLKDNIKEKLPQEVDIDAEDFYWDIPENALYDPYIEPENLTLGQISEDWKELLRLKEQNSIAISYDLKRLSVILQIIRKSSNGIW